MSIIIGMISSTNLKRRETKMRKIDDKPHLWKRTSDMSLKEVVNRYHFSPAVFTYRRGDKIVRGADWILIDVDEPGSNVEEKLLDFKLRHVISPSASASDTVTHKKHIFVKTLRLSKDPAIARAQITDFYNVLGLENVDLSAVDPVRYFAPGGAAEVYGSDAWKQRVAWCDARTVVNSGTAWTPLDEDSVVPIYSGSGKQVRIKTHDLGNTAYDDDDWEPELLGRDNKNTGGITYFLENDTPISTGNDTWTVAGTIAAQLNDGETVSNVIGCPGYNREHTDPSTVGYGYVTRQKDWVFFSCGGDSCKGDSYCLKSPLFEDEEN